MDKEFLEFWGNYLLSVARGKRQMEDVAQWWRQGLSGFDDLSGLFRRAYNLDPDQEEQPPDMGVAWERAAEAFRQAFADYLGSFGMVSREEYQSVLEENERLRGKVSEQEKTIERLQRLLRDRALMDPEELSDQFQRILEKQAETFHKMMGSWQESDK